MIKKMIAPAVLSLGLSMAAAAPASAAPNNADQSGLVNLALQDTVVQVPIGVAANICGVAVNLLSSATAVGAVDCTAEGVATAERAGGRGANNARQNGLVNVAVQDTTVQVPVAVAANICGVGANVVATFTAVGDVTCDALADAEANG
jgi:hypothetical protein